MGRRLSRSAALRLARLHADRSGGAVVEFALILPVMILVLLATVELVQAAEAQRRTSHVAYAIADLVTQSKMVTNGDLQAIFTGGTLLMEPLPAATLGQRIMSVSADEEGRITTDWVQQASQGAYAGTAPATLPQGSLPANESAIVADVSYTFTPGVTMIRPQGFRLEKRAVLMPRLSQQVALR